MEELKNVFSVTGKFALQYNCLCKLRGLELVFYKNENEVEVWKTTDLQAETMTTYEMEDRFGFTFVNTQTGRVRKMATADRTVYSRWKDELLFIMANIAERGSSVNPHPDPKFDSSEYPVRPNCYLCQNKSKWNCSYCKNSCCPKCVGKAKLCCYLCFQAQTYFKLSTEALKSCLGAAPPNDKDALMLCREELVKKRDRRHRKAAALRKENARRNYQGSSFIDACNAADLINIKASLAAGQDVNTLDGKGNNCILILCSKNWAAQKVDLNEILLCLQYLLSCKANANARDSSYKTPLHWCCEKGYHLFIPDLLRNGAKTTSQTLEGENAFDIAFALKQESCVKTLDEFDTQIINDWSDKKKRRTCFEKYPALALNYKTLEGDTLLHIAAKNNDNELITDLINAGAKVNTKNYSGFTFFNNLIIFGDGSKTTTIDLIMKLPNFDTSASDYYGITYLHYAAFKDREHIIQQLLRCRASPFTVDKIFNGTPLHVAFAANKQRAVAALMVYRILPTLANNQGKLPDNLCTNKSTFTNIVKNNTILDAIEAGQKPLIPVTVEAYDVKDYAGNSIFHYAMNFGSDDLSNQYAKEAQGRKVELKNYKGQTVEDVTRLGGDMTIMSSIKAYSSILPDLLTEVSLGDDYSGHLQDFIAQKQVGAMIKHQYSERQYKTVLHIAVESNFVECVRVLSNQAEVSLAVQDQNGQTPLHLACIHGLDGCLATMLGSLAFDKSCLDVKDNKGNTALLLSCQPSDNEATMTGKKNCTTNLLEKGANSKILNNDGKRAKDVATDTEVLHRLDLLSHFDELTEAIKLDNLTACVNILKGKEAQWKIDLLNTRDSNGRNFLIVAVDLQRPMFVKLLVKEGASMDMPDKEDRTARRLLEQQESNSNTNLKAVDDYDYRRQEEFIEMCANGRTNEVEEILQMNPKYVQSSLRSGETPLYCAAVGGIPSRGTKLRKNGFPEVIKVLAKYGAETKRRVFATGDTALHGACYWANAGCVEQLLVMGCDTTITNTQGKTAREVIPLKLAEVDKRSTHFTENKITEEDISQIFEFLQESSLFDRLLIAAGRGRDEMKRVAKEIYKSNVPEYAQQQVKPLIDDRRKNLSPQDAPTESNTNVLPGMVEKRELLMNKQTVISHGVITYDKKQASIKRIFNAYDKSGNTLLHIYVEQLNVDVVSFFLENHADPLKPNKDGLKPSQILTKLEDIIDESDKRRGDLVILRERLKAWENFHHFVNLLQKKDFDQTDELQFGQELTFAGPNGFTLLHWAVLRKREVAVRMLTESVNKSPMKKDRNGNTPIHWAAILGHDVILSILLESLENESKKLLINQPNDQNFTPLLLSCLFHGETYDNCIKSLLDIANKFLALRKDLLSPLIMCAVSENYDIMIKLLEQGFDPNVQDDSLKQTPLLLAIYQGSNAEVLTELIEKGASINVPDEDGYTPLMLACKKGNPRNVNILLSSKKELELTARNSSNGWSAIHFAVHSGIMEIVTALLNKEVNIVNQTAANGYAPLHIAMMTKNIEMIKFLILNGADVRVTLVILGIPLELDEIARIVEDDNNDILALILSGQLWRSLIDAAKRGWTRELNVTVSALSELAPLGSDLFTINTADPTESGQTALHLACKNGDTANVKTLLQHNVDTTVKDAFGKCAVDHCDQSPGIKTLLEQKDKCTQLLDFTTACTKNIQSEDAKCAVELAELLNKLPGVLNDIKSFGDQRLHPIHEFAKKGYEACCKVLVAAKKECIRMRDKDGNTPVHLAVLNGHLAVLTLLCREAADVAWLELKNNRGVSPLELAREEVIARNSERNKHRALECANLLAKYTNDDSASEDESSESESSSSESESESDKKKKRKAKKKKKAKKIEKAPAKDEKDGPEKDNTTHTTEKKDGELKDDAKKDSEKKDDDKGKSEKNTTESSQASSPKKSHKKKNKSIKRALEKFKVLYERHKHQNDENMDKSRIIEKGLSEWKKSKEEFNERTNTTSKLDEVKKIRELVGKIRISSNLTQIEEHCIALVALLDRLR